MCSEVWKSRCTWREGKGTLSAEDDREEHMNVMASERRAREFTAWGEVEGYMMRLKGRTVCFGSTETDFKAEFTGERSFGV